MFKIIVCTNNIGVIGRGGDLVYKISEDLQNFKRMTVGNVVIMGWNTFQSLPNKKPLKDRTNIVITSKDVESEYENLVFVKTIEDVIKICSRNFKDKEWFVIGGGSIYRQFLEASIVDTIFETKVIDNTEGDTYFPIIKDGDGFKLFYESGTIFHQPPYSFRIWKKIPN